MVFLDFSMFSLSMELERLNSEPCACFSGFISPVPPFPQLLLEALDFCMCPSAASNSMRSRGSPIATFLRLAFSVPFLGFVEEEDPLFWAVVLGESDLSFTSSSVSCFLYWNRMGEPPLSAQSYFSPPAVCG